MASEKRCIDCGNPITPYATRCRSCAKRGNKNMLGRKHTLEARRRISESRRGEKNPNWNGGRTHNKQGYILVLSTAHPHADANGYVREHRLVVEKALGRYLKRDELVHHINGVKDDNRLQNLQLINHHRQAICPRCTWPMGNLQAYISDGPTKGG